MNNRFQWLRVERMSAPRLASGAAQMLQLEFSDENGWGFLLDETRPAYITGRFIERDTIHEEITTPLGASMHFERVVYTETKFRLSVSPPELEFVEPPRSKAFCLTQLSQAFGMEFTVLPLRWKMFPLLSILEREVSDVVVRGATVNNLLLAKGTSAKCIFTGEMDVRLQLQRFLGNRSFETTALKVDFRLKSGFVSAEFRRDGRAHIQSGLNEQTLDEFRQLVSLAAATLEEDERRKIAG